MVIQANSFNTVRICTTKNFINGPFIEVKYVYTTGNIRWYRHAIALKNAKPSCSL